MTPIGASERNGVVSRAIACQATPLKSRTRSPDAPTTSATQRSPCGLNAGVPATEVAARAGHGVDVLLRVYASCIDGSELIANARFDAAPNRDRA